MKRLILAAAIVVAGCSANVRETPTPVPTPTEAPLPADPAAKLEAIVRREFSGTNNRDVPYLRAVSVIPQVDGGFAVKIDFNAADNLSEDFIRRGIENEMEDAYIALYASGEHVREVWIGAYFPLLDSKGNSSDELVLRTMLDAAMAEEINWSEPALVDWPAVWKTTSSAF